jgi:pimeloyl-ACP methyl ester carboxylesterase
MLLLFCLPILAACQEQTAPTTAPTPTIELTDCRLSFPGGTQRVPAKCGSYEVFEDRQAASGRKISLNLAVIPAVSRSPEPDPIFYLAGGPGEAATQSFIVLYASLNRLNQKRAIVLVDQRGTGASNPLFCPQEDALESEEDDPAELQAYLQDCLAGLDADPRLYTTSIAMDDLDEVRQALGYDQINLYGASYGTRAALVYARQHPDHLRSMILDGVVPLDWTLGPAVAGDAQRALDLLFQRCAADSACAAAFPNLPDEFQAVIQRLQGNPVTVNLDHPTTGQPTEYDLTLETFANTIHTLTYAPETAALLPLMIHQAYQDDFRPLAAQSLTTTEQLQSVISTGMRFSVVCSEDVPFYGQTPNSAGYLGEQFDQVFSEICQTWPSGSLPPDFKQPVQSDVPTLLLSGEYDPVTPPANAEQAAQTLSNSLHIIAPQQGHIVIFRGCIPTLAADFVEAASFETLDTSCVADLTPMPFFVSPTGPQP